MKLCTTTVVTGLDGKNHFAIAAVGQQSWPIAVFGLVDGANAKLSEAEAKFFADAPAMMDMLEYLADEFGGDISPNIAAEQSKLESLVERAASLVAKHASLCRRQS